MQPAPDRRGWPAPTSTGVTTTDGAETGPPPASVAAGDWEASASITTGWPSWNLMTKRRLAALADRWTLNWLPKMSAFKTWPRSSAVGASSERSMTESQNRQRTLARSWGNSRGAPQFGQVNARNADGSGIGISPDG